MMLVGFEWAGKAGQARYPVSLHTFERAFWAMGTVAGGLIEKVHDIHMVRLMNVYYM